jgi:ribosomal protein L15
LTKKLVVLADGFSAKAKEAIVAAGGKAQVR